jgi:succinate dehydrogenase/fumarate reductase iron-sulfur protein
MITIPIKPVSMSAVAPAPASGTAVNRKVQIKVLRYNPAQPEVAPHWQTYELDDAPGMTLFIALSEIRDRLDASLQFDFVCRAGICGSCAMLVNGKPALACRVLTKKLDPVITLAPLPVFELIGDLSVNTGKWMRGMSERLQTWVQAQETAGRPAASSKPAWTPSWPTKSTSLTAASNVAAAWPPAARRACARTLSAPWA